MQRNRPGIAKTSSLSADRREGALGSAIVRSVLGDLDALIAKRDQRTGAAFAWGTREQGGARLIHASGAGHAESVRFSWNHREIVSIEIESRNDPSFCGPEAPADPAELMSWLVPRVWAHIQRGGSLPTGIDRFASFF